jgi:thiol-disulfide isomerase/thioredoxin
MERTNISRSRIWLRRPDHIVWTTQGDAGSNAMAVDGKSCTLFLPSLNRYTVTAVGGDVSADEKLSSMAAPFGQVVSALLSADLTSATLAEVLAGAPVLLQPEVVYGVPCNHLQLTLAGGSQAELWLAMGVAPVPVHIATTQGLPPAAGQKGLNLSQSNVDFRWKFNVELPDSTFRLYLTPTAMKVDQLGGPNLAAGSWKPATGKPTGPKRKPLEPVINSRKMQEQEQLASLATPAARGGKLTTPPSMNMNDNSVPSLSQGLPSNSVNLQPQKSARTANLGQTQQVAPPPQATARPQATPATQQFSPPATGRMNSPVTRSVATAPDVTLPLLDGGRVKLSQLRGKKAVVLDFWATWCGPCRQAMPSVAEVARAWQGRGVDFYAVNMAEDSNSVKTFAKQQGMSVPVAMDTDGSAAQAFGVSGIPHLVVIGRDGTIRSVHTGASNDLKQTLMRELESAVQ